MRLLPETFQKFIINRLIEISGVLLIFTSCFIFASILSFTPLDPSLTNLTYSNITNIGGEVGAGIADILIQLFGYASVSISLVLMVW